MEEDKILPIVVGQHEAQGIIVALKEEETPRPITYDLTKTLCDKLGGKIEKIIITDIKDDVFYAEIFLTDDTNTFQIDSRPSDAIALALRYDAPIFMNFQLIEFTCDYEDILDERI